MIHVSRRDYSSFRVAVNAQWIANQEPRPCVSPALRRVYIDLSTSDSSDLAPSLGLAAAAFAISSVSRTRA